MTENNTRRSIFVTCRECGSAFEIAPDEQDFFRTMGFELPKRCANCRKARRNARKAAEKKKAEPQNAAELKNREDQLAKDENELAKILKTLPFEQMQLGDITLAEPSKSLVVIGNGFDIMHGAKSSYRDFQKTVGRNSTLRFYMETYLDVDDLWADLEESLGRLNYSAFLTPEIIDMWLDDFGAYDPEAQAADFFAAVETAIAPTFEIPAELNKRFGKWVKTLTVNTDSRPFSMLHGDYRVLCFNYTEFIEELYGAKPENVCYIHGCRKNRKRGKPDELILGHRPGMENEQWDKVRLKPYRFKDPYKRYIMEAALETAAREAAWYDESTTKNCDDIIKAHSRFFDGLYDVREIYIIGHSLSEVDHPYFREICQKTDADWYMGFHSLADMKRLLAFVKEMHLKKVTVFRT